MVVLGPFSWKKLKGGLEIAWVGYELTLAELRLGISASRARCKPNPGHNQRHHGKAKADSNVL